MRSRPLRRLATAAAVAATALLATTDARALAVDWSVDHAASPLAIEVTLTNPFLGTRTGAGATAVSGTAAGDVTDPLGVPSVAFSGASFLLDDTSFSIVLGGLFGTVDVTYDSVGASFTSGAVLAVPIGPGTFEIDLAGSVLTLDTGFVHATHPMMNATTDFASDPTVFVLGTTLATLVVTDLGGGLLDLEFLAPLDLTAALPPIAAPIVGNVDTTVRMFGPLRLTATLDLGVPVPEPGTALLLAAGLTGLLVIGRRTS